MLSGIGTPEGRSLVGWLIPHGRNLEPRRPPVSGSHAEGDRVPRQKNINMDQIWARESVTRALSAPTLIIMRHEHNHHSPYLWRVCRRDSQSDAITAMHTRSQLVVAERSNVASVFPPTRRSPLCCVFQYKLFFRIHFSFPFLLYPSTVQECSSTTQDS